MPTLLENGHLLVFDNGVHRDHSRVLEVGPVTGEIIWQYQSVDFYSQWRGSNQRLPNGNTLICESETGRVFEVDPLGEIVWEFYNPELKDGKRKRIYRLMRYAPEQLEELLLDRFPAIVEAPGDKEAPPRVEDHDSPSQSSNLEASPQKLKRGACLTFLVIPLGQRGPAIPVFRPHRV